MSDKFFELRREIVTKRDKQLAFVDQHALQLREIIDAIDRHEPTRVWFDDDGEYLGLAFSGDRHKLQAVFGMLRRFGLTPSSRPEAKSPEYYAFFSESRDEGALAIFLQFSSTQCRRVKIGEKTVTQDVYEIVCDEMVLDAPVPAEPVITTVEDDIPW